jgi:hypothetical protein
MLRKVNKEIKKTFSDTYDQIAKLETILEENNFHTWGIGKDFEDIYEKFKNIEEELPFLTKKWMGDDWIDGWTDKE